MALSPLDGAARLAGMRGRVLLHAGRDDDGLGRWSFDANGDTSISSFSGRVWKGDEFAFVKVLGE